MNKRKTKSTIGLRVIIVAFASYGLFQLFTSSISSDEAKSHEESAYQKKFDEGYNIYSISAPKLITFAGDSVPLDNPEVFERLDREVISNTYFHSNTLMYFKRAYRWFPIIEPILKENNIPDDFKYLALIESGFQNVISPAGATGFWQFMEKTAKEYNLEINDEVDERYHLQKSTIAACKYLQEAYNEYGDWALVAASYNAGKNRITTELEKQKAKTYYELLLNSETKRYVFRILAVKQILSNPELYGFNIRKSDLYLPISYTTIEIDTSIADFADFAKDHNISYKTLKYFNPWLRQSYLRNRNAKTYTIHLPTDKNYFLN